MLGKLSHSHNLAQLEPVLKRPSKDRTPERAFYLRCPVWERSSQELESFLSMEVCKQRLDGHKEAVEKTVNRGKVSHKNTNFGTRQTGSVPITSQASVSLSITGRKITHLEEELWEQNETMHEKCLALCLTVGKSPISPSSCSNENQSLINASDWGPALLEKH